MFTHSRHVPGVNYAGLDPSGPDRLPARPASCSTTWNTRETALFDTDPDRVPPLAALPYAETAHMGRMTGEARAKAAAPKAPAPCRRASMAATATSRICRAARRSISRSMSTGAGLSMGDLHFSQGDGEITFCGAIEMAGWLHIKVNLIKGGMAKYGDQEPDLQAEPDHAEVRRLPDLRRHLRRRGRQAALSRRPHRLSPGLPQRHRVPEEVRLHRRPGLRHPRHRAGARAISPAWSTSRTPAPRSGCRPRSSSSTSCRARTGRRRSLDRRHSGAAGAGSLRRVRCPSTSMNAPIAARSQDMRPMARSAEPLDCPACGVSAPASC